MGNLKTALQNVRPGSGDHFSVPSRAASFSIFKSENDDLTSDAQKTRPIFSTQYNFAKPALYSPVVTTCTGSLKFNNSTFCPDSVFMCFVWISEQTAIISLYSIN
jgi:hypothetical protein